jgi:hypothetical protein
VERGGKMSNFFVEDLERFDKNIKSHLNNKHLGSKEVK